MNKKDFKKYVKEAIEDYKTEYDGVYYYSLGNGLFFVIGWQDGYDEDKNDSLSSGEYHVCGKIAYNCDDLQCDYNWDWEMPMDTESGGTYDTEREIYEKEDLDKLYDFVKAEYKNIVSELKNGTLKFSVMSNGTLKYLE